MKDITKVIDPYTGKPFRTEQEYQAYLNLQKFLKKPTWKTLIKSVA